MRNLKVILLLIMLASCNRKDRQADMIIINAQIWTGNIENSRTSAMAIRGDRIMALGTTEQLIPLAGDKTHIIDLQGYFITPGFIDSHVHFLTGGKNLSSVQLRNAGTKEEFISRISAFARTQQPGTWITGGDWDHKLWGGDLPKKEWIDSVTSQNPILINRLDGHMALANSLALELLQINPSTHIADGEIEKYENGQLTGILREEAYYSQLMKIPPSSQEVEEGYALAAMNYVAAQGVTSVHDMNGFHDQAVFERLHAEGKLITRIYSSTPLSNWQALKAKIDTTGYGDKWVRIGGLKGFVDGSLGSHTAAFTRPYSDDPNSVGYFVNSKEDLHQWIHDADLAGLQVMVHAIGDSANHTLLNIYEQVSRENGPRDRRFRIEHAQHLLPEDIPRFAILNVIASMQPYHAIDDGRWAEEVIGHERARTTYAFHSLLKQGAHLTFGSDWFVAPPKPLIGIFAATTRQTLDGENPEGWMPEQKINVEEALRAYTINAAYASFEENIKGSLEPGKLADFVVLDKDLTSIPPEEIKDVRVMRTYIGGKQVYSNNSN